MSSDRDRPDPGVNTRLLYMYRDGNNWKWSGKVILRGEPDEILERRLRGGLWDGDGFNAEQLGIPEVFPWVSGEMTGPAAEDHALHELLSVEPTREPTTDDRSISDLVAEVERIGRSNWSLELSDGR